MQVAFEEREPSILQPTSLDCALSLEEDVQVPPTCEEHTKDIGTDLELQPTSTTFCESIPLLVPPCDLSCNNVTAPCDSLPNSHFDHVVLITHKEILARIPPTEIVYSIMLNEPMNMSCVVDRISEISYLNSSTYSPYFIFNLI